MCDTYMRVNENVRRSAATMEVSHVPAPRRGPLAAAASHSHSRFAGKSASVKRDLRKQTELNNIKTITIFFTPPPPSLDLESSSAKQMNDSCLLACFAGPARAFKRLHSLSHPPPSPSSSSLPSQQHKVLQS